MGSLNEKKNVFWKKSIKNLKILRILKTLKKMLTLWNLLMNLEILIWLLLIPSSLLRLKRGVL